MYDCHWIRYKQTINKKNKPNIKPSGIYFKDTVAQAHFQVLYIVQCWFTHIKDTYILFNIIIFINN